MLNGLIGVAVVAVVGVALVDAVLGGNDRTDAADSGDDLRMRATLTDDGCSYRGDTTAEAGRFTIEVENETERDASFAFVRLAEGFTAATVRPILARESAWVRSLSKDDLFNIAEGNWPLGRPDVTGIFDFRFGFFTEIGGGASSDLLGVGVPAGSYAVICRVSTREKAEQMLLWEEQYVAAQIEVTGVLPGVTTP